MTKTHARERGMMTIDAMTGETAQGGPPPRTHATGERHSSVRIIGADRAGGTDPPAGGASGPGRDAGGTAEQGDSQDTSEVAAADAQRPRGADSTSGFGPEDWADVAAADEPALPHWTEAPTGEIPAVLSRGEHGAEDDDPWAALPEPSWREGRADWAHAEPIAPALGSEDAEGSGFVVEADMAERQPWSFELGEDQSPGPEDDLADAYGSGLAYGTGRAREEPSTSEDLGDLDAGDLFGATAADRSGGSEAMGPGPRHAGSAHRDEPRGAEDDAAGVIAGERTSILHLTAIAAAGAGAREEAGGGEDAQVVGAVRDAPEAGRAAAGDSTAGGTDAERDEPVGMRHRRGGLRAPVGRRSTPSQPRSAPVEPTPRGTRAASAGTRAAMGASRTLRRGEDAVSQRTGRNITAAIVSGAAIGALALVAFHFGTVPSMVVVTAVLTVAAMEGFGAFRRAGYRPATLLGLVGVVGLLVATYNKTTEALPAVLVLLVAATFIWHLVGVDRRAEPVRSISATLLVFCWVGVFGSFAALLLAPSLFPHRTGIAYLLGALVTAVAYDVGALGAGAWVGRHPLSAVSPGKTWEGVIGGAVVAIAVSAGVVHLIHPWSLKEAVVLGVVVAVVSPVGDLCESLVKRHLGLKDMGRILPGHGGLLDRVDGLLFVLPATYYLVRAFH